MIIYSERVCLPDGIRPAYLIEENGRIKAVAGKEAGLKADVDYGNQRIIPGIMIPIIMERPVIALMMRMKKN